MTYLIDGHNLIPCIPGLHLGEVDDEIKLIQILQSFCHRSGKSVEVYFDNAPPGMAGKRRYGMVTANFVRQGNTADNAIRKRLEILKGQAAEYIVVSSDRQIQAVARAARARPISSPEFAQHIDSIQDISANQNAGEHPGILTEDEVEEWLQIFKDHRDRTSGQSG